MNNRPLFSVCIPAYNRAEYLAPLLDSILQQDFDDYEILICEDGSPQRAAIKTIADKYAEQHAGKIRFEENPKNLGYDGNIRQLVASARGRFCVFMGNDDLMCTGALPSIADVVARVKDCGVVVRTYATFDADPNLHKQVFRYYPMEHIVAPGKDAIAVGYRRSVVIPGMVINRDAAAAIASSQFDGTLLYQLYLVGIILAKYSVVFTPHIIALRRDGTPPDFGNSESEKGKFVPQDQTLESSVHFVAGMLKIAKYIETTTQLAVYDAIRQDMGAYSYPILSIQAKRPFGMFLRYGYALAKLGLWRSPLFHMYFLMLLVVGKEHTDGLIKKIKTRLGYTPRLGSARSK